MLLRVTGDSDGARVLEALLAALGRWPDVGSQPRMNLEQWNALTVSEVKAYQDKSIAAVRAVDDLWPLTDQIREVGRLRHEPAVPTLIRLWQECPVNPVMVAAGHALFAIGTVEARDALRSGIHDHDHLGRFLALKVMFTDDGTPWDNVGHLFSDASLATAAGVAAAYDALGHLPPVSQDRRWLDLCVRLRDHEILGGPAREVLQQADPAVIAPALDAARAARPAPARPPHLRPGDLVTRYRDGDHRGVWRDLGAVAHLDDRWRAEAEQVAALTMERVRQNAVNLTAALQARGWPVTVAKALPGPAADVEDRLLELEQITGSAVPPALAAYWRIVGTIDLVPRDTWDGPFPAGVPEELTIADPLEIVDRGLAFAVERWQDKTKNLHPELTGPMKIAIAADHLHKANISGGAPYSVRLPDTGADPLVRDEEHGLTFTDYLRHAFAGKGFLRLDRQDEWRAYYDFTSDDLAELTGWLDGVDYEHLDF